MADLQGVYARTAAGLKEIKARALQLTREQRNLLIVMDGKSPLGSFARLAGCAPEQLGEVAAPLIEHGLIAPANRGSTPPSPAGAAPAAGAAALNALIALAEQLFETHAGPIVRKLEKAGAAGADLPAAIESAAKLAKLTIDESKAQAFLGEARRLLSS